MIRAYQKQNIDVKEYNALNNMYCEAEKRADKYKFLFCIACILILAFSVVAFADPLQETRYVGEPKRDENGNIIRRADVINAFKREHPCPSTGKKTGACKGWQINHVIPLACGGEDAVSNMQWLPTVTKTCWQDWCADRYERKIYAASPKQKGTDRCANEIVIINDKVQ